MKRIICAVLLLACTAFASNSDNPNKCKPKPKPPVHNPTPKPQPKPTPSPKPTTPTSSSTSGATSTADATASSTSNSSASATGGTASQQQGQQQSTSSSANGNGNGSNNSVSNTTYQAPKFPVNTAYAPDMLPTADCIKGNSGGAQTAPFGLTLGLSKEAEGCEIRHDALVYLAGGSRLAYCKMMITGKKSKKAHITLEDCMAAIPPIVAVPDAPVATEERLRDIPPMISTYVEPPMREFQVLQTCDFTGLHADNTCKAKLDAAVMFFESAEGGYITVDAQSGNRGMQRTDSIVSYLVHDKYIAPKAIWVRLTAPKTEQVFVGYALTKE